ncbi:MAG: PEP-CTERM sorting domain-containing protein [Gemmataceae bacterium]
MTRTGWSSSSGAVSLGAFTGASVTAALSGNPLYFGNPSTGQDPSEIFAFINFFADGGDSFDRVEFTNGPSTGFEVDNFTLDRTQAVPEPTSLAMLATGLVMGAGYARRRLRPAR